jgi:hypothetical protein
MNLTPTQERLMAVLRDGEPHTYRELNACLNDELANPGNLKNHVCILNKKLQANGLMVACLTLGRAGRRYRLVGLVKPTTAE